MGQKSAVDRLPEKLRNKLLEMLHNPAVTQEEIADAINGEAGEPLVSRSSVNRYARRIKKFAEKNR
jgi:DNA-binding transcriptional regulator WhiA